MRLLYKVDRREGFHPVIGGSETRQGCFLSPLLFNIYVMPVKHDMRGVGVITRGWYCCWGRCRGRQTTEARSQGAELISR